jgi:hypothetical protein
MLGNKKHLAIYRHKSKKENSKSMLVLYWVQTLATATALFSFWNCIYAGDASALTVLIPSVFVDASAVTALVLWKRKNERAFSFFSDEEMRKAIEWFKEHDIDPIDFFRALKE